ncbi:MAG TPA: hypothetical protein PKL77_03375 [Candidatus Omnitrophota bacterium]|nr:hypothetical protein [Candidatus Omnitrophota bacterium]HPT07306.1 hypothetical protein [Candidatus Omnitrophota bacterium]
MNKVRPFFNLRMSKKEVYTLIKLAGILTYVPLVMATGPLIGFIVGDVLVKKLHWASYTVLVLVAFGFLGSIIEVIRIVRLCKKMDA